jgi:hypothetical protein
MKQILYSVIRLLHVRALAVSVFVIVLASETSEAQPIEVRGGNQTLNITSGFAGGEPVAVTNTNSSLRYRRQARRSKITVRTACPGQNFNLSVEAQGVSRGVAAPAVQLIHGMLDTDFIVNIPATGFTRTTITLRYMASATFAQGNSAELGNDVHTVTYTILAQ